MKRQVFPFIQTANFMFTNNSSQYTNLDKSNIFVLKILSESKDYIHIYK